MRLPLCSGVATPRTLPERAAAKKLVFDSSVAVFCPAARLTTVPAAPMVSAKAISVPPCSAPLVVSSSGRIEFLDAPPGRGTMVRATFAYDPPAGGLGEWFAKLFQREPNVQARRDLRRLKQFLETGEVTSSAGPSGRDEDPTEQHV